MKIGTHVEHKRINTLNYDKTQRSFTCSPTLNDSQVLSFCREGHLILPGVVPDEINQRTCDWLAGNIPANPSYVPDGMSEEDLLRIRTSHEPSNILLEDWFIEHVLLNPKLTGVLRSLLGPKTGLPVLVSHHQMECPADSQSWHHDADHVFGPELRFLEVFYFPQDTPIELGPTEVAPGTHIRHTDRHTDKGGIFCDGPAGTIGIHHQSILHRRGKSTASGIRRMLKYNYWRTSPPDRDWLIDPDFDFAKAYYGGHESARYYAHMFYWLCGKGDQFRTIGGQGFPWKSDNQIGPSYGYNSKEGYIPDWRGSSNDGYA